MSENFHNTVSFILSCVSLWKRTPSCQSGNGEQLVDIDSFSFI